MNLPPYPMKGGGGGFFILKEKEIFPSGRKKGGGGGLPSFLSVRGGGEKLARRVNL